MKVSLTWLALLLIGVAVIVLLLQGRNVYEAFQGKISEGFQSSAESIDISINTCPAKMTPFINNEGHRVCLEEGTNNVVCSLNDAKEDSSCSKWLYAKLAQKGLNMCPNSMQNYFESADGKMRGCTAGKRKADGSGPLDSSFCRLYATRSDENKNENSCSNQKILESAMCPFGTRKLVWEKFDANGKPIGELRPYVMCDFTVPDSGIKKNCAITSTYRNMQKDYKENLDKSFNPEYIQDTRTNWKDYFCPVAKKVYFDKSVSLEDASKLDVDTGDLLSGQSFSKPAIKPGRKVANEYETVTVSPNTLVFYGTQQTNVSKIVSGKFTATNEFFGKDPVPGNVKSVFLGENDAQQVLVGNCATELPTSFVPKQNTLLAQGFQIAEHYKLSFTITIQRVRPNWTNIVRFTATNNDCCNFSDRSPAIFIFPGDTRLHVRIGDKTDGNWGFDTNAVPLNRPTTFVLECKNNNVKLTLGNEVIARTQPSNRFSGPGRVFAGDPSYEGANAMISDFCYERL